MCAASDLPSYLDAELKRIAPDSAVFAIAFSGGGDSTALLHALKDNPKAKLALIVDHGLRAESAKEAETAAGFAQRLGYETHILTWRHTSPTTGLQEKARSARYGLMGDVCRARGIQYLVTGHTEDDQAETLLMRYDRQTDWRGAAGMRQATYGPVWPQLAALNVLRPLLSVTRQALRDYNQSHALSWVDDPSNDNADFARIRARQALTRNTVLRTTLLNAAKDLHIGRQAENRRVDAWLRQYAGLHPMGFVTTTATPSVEGLFRLIRAVSGQGGDLDRAKLRRLVKDVRQTDFKAATLGGAHIERHPQGLLFCRDNVAVKGRNNQARLGPQKFVNGLLVWDGRFLLRAPVGFTVRPAYEQLQTLQADFGPTLKSLPPRVRATLPVIYDSTGQVVAAGIETRIPTVSVINFTSERLFG